MQGTFSSLTLGKRRWRCVMLCSPHKNFQIRNIFFLKVINVFLVVCWNDKNGTCKEQVPTKRERLKGWTRSFSREVGCCFKLRLWSRLSPSSLRDHSASTSWTMTQPFSRQPSPTIIYLQATIVNYQRRKGEDNRPWIFFITSSHIGIPICIQYMKLFLASQDALKVIVWVSHWVIKNQVDWCDPGEWRYLLKTLLT